MTPFFVSFAVSFILVPVFTKLALNHTSPMKPELEEHSSKAGTPSSGSFAILLSVLVSEIFFTSSPVRGTYALTALLFALVGITDDVLKVIRKSPDGLKSMTKLSLQTLSSLAVIYVVRAKMHMYESIPWMLWYPSALLYMLIFVNGVNITDGLDSLAVKCSLPPLLATFFCFSFLRNESVILSGALLGFLWYNSHRASVFMGDGGSHLTGALIALLGLLSGRPEAMLIASLPFMSELLSSFIQIFSIRVFGRKVFPIAPLHHAFQKSGMGEEKITDRAMVLSFLASFLSATLVKGWVV